MLGSLIYLFTDPRLPGGAQQAVDIPYKGSSMTGLFNVTPAQERLDFVLWITQSPSTGKLTDTAADIAGLGTHFNEFVETTDRTPGARSDTGFAEQFRDGGLWVKSSRQVGHFLTAAHLGRANLGAECAVGHELRADGTGELGQCLAGEFATLQFLSAVDADLSGDDARRACFIDSIMYDLPETFNPADFSKQSGNDRSGNSRQDLRLTIKGWGFGRLIQHGDIATLAQTQEWLIKNLR